jgi:acyl carrier protein
MPDGCLVHVGRKDFQAKIRGHRVEVSAVETALYEIPAVKQAAVVVSDDVEKRSRLIAYVAPKARHRLTSAKLRAQLKLRLPDYMVPAYFVILQRLPMTSAGKVDRNALPLPENLQRAGALPRAKPRDSIEQVLISLWREQLATDSLGIDDDLAELGADSLSAARIVASVTELFPLRMPLSTLFETPTIARLAEFIRTHELVPGQSDKIASVFLKVEAMSATEVLAVFQKN